MKLLSLERSLRTMEVLSRYPRSLSLSELSRLTGDSRSTLHHILHTLLPHGYIFQDAETKKYSLGLKFLAISKGILDNLDIRKAAHPALRQLHEKYPATSIHLYLFRQGKIVCIEKINSVEGLSLATYIGFSTDPHATASGKVFLSEIPPEKIKDLYQDRPLKKYGKKTITNLNKLIREIIRVKSQGFAVDDEEYYEGVRCIAAPIRKGNEVEVVLSMTGSIFTMTWDKINRELKNQVIRTAKEISQALNLLQEFKL